MKVARIFSCIVLVLLMNVSFLHAQNNKVAGKIVDARGNSIPNATISVLNTNTQSIIAYKISNKDGYFTISIDSINNRIIKINCIGYAILEKAIPVNGQVVTYVLEEKQRTLPTVVVKNSPISIEGDTTTYTLSSFAKKQDRVIGEVLSRIPGIEIDANGGISYNGTPISNYYIDGLDLLGTKYNIANQNIPAELVEKIQLLNNHQALKALDSFAVSNAVALNIKLKDKAKDRLIGKAQLGVGIAPLLWNNEITTMNFRRNIQLIAAYKNNNSGTNLYNELNDNVAATRVGEQNDDLENSSLLSLVKLPSVSLPPKRYTFNNSHLLHLNILKLLKNKGQLKLNISQYIDNNRANGNNFIAFYLPNDTIPFSENYVTKKRENKFKAELNYTLNTEKYYLKNLLTYKNEYTSENGNVISDDNILQKLSSNTNTINNEFILNKVKKRKLFNISSKLSYSVMPQILSVSPGPFANIFNGGSYFPLLVQRAGIKNIFSNTSISLAKKMNSFQYEGKLGVATSNLYLQSHFQDPQDNNIVIKADSLTNDLTWETITPSLTNTFSYLKKKRKIEIIIPIEANYISQQNNATSGRSSHNSVFINPRLDITLPLNSKVDMQLGYVKQTSVKSVLETYNGYILNNYRTLRQNDTVIPWEKLNTFSGSFSYKDPLTGTFLYLISSYTCLQKNLLFSNFYNNSLTRSSAIEKKNNQYNINFSLYFNKYFLSSKTNLSIRFFNSNVRSTQLLQNIETQISTLSTALTIKTSFNKFKWGNIESSSTLQKSSSQLSQQQKSNSKFKNLNVQNTISCYFFITKKIYASIKMDQYYFDNKQNNHSNYLFSDLGLKYKNKSIDIEIALTNITNNKVFTTSSLNKNVSQEFSYAIRPTNALLKIFFPF